MSLNVKRVKQSSRAMKNVFRNSGCNFEYKKRKTLMQCRDMFPRYLINFQKFMHDN